MNFMFGVSWVDLPLMILTSKRDGILQFGRFSTQHFKCRLPGGMLQLDGRTRPMRRMSTPATPKGRKVIHVFSIIHQGGHLYCFQSSIKEDNYTVLVKKTKPRHTTTPQPPPTNPPPLHLQFTVPAVRWPDAAQPTSHFAAELQQNPK